MARARPCRRLDTNYAGGSRQLWYLAALVHWRLFLILTSGMRRWSLLLLSLVVGLGSGYCAGLSSEILYTRLFVDLGAVRARQLTVHVHGLLSIDRALALLPLYVGGHLAAQLSGLRVEGPDGGAASAPAEGAGGKTALADSAVKWLRRGPAGGTAAARGASLLAACALLGTAVGCHWPVRAWGYLYTFGWQTSYADAWIALGNSPADLDGSLTHSLLWVRCVGTESGAQPLLPSAHPFPPPRHLRHRPEPRPPHPRRTAADDSRAHQRAHRRAPRAP